MDSVQTIDANQHSLQLNVVVKWRAIFIDKGLKVNAGKSKVMVGSNGGKMIVNSGKLLCGVCGKGVQATSVHCTSTARNKWMDEVLIAFAISDIRCSPVGYERSSVCQLCQKQHYLWK